MKKFVLFIAFVCLFFSCCLFSACSSIVDTGSELSEVEKGRAYLAQVNDFLGNIDDDLKSFSDAASRNDLVAVQSNAKKINDSISLISNLDVPDIMQSVHKKYLSGCDKLKQALNDYVSLYCNVINNGEGFDTQEYAQKLSAIQSQYLNGLKVLKEADQALSDLNNNQDKMVSSINGIQPEFNPFSEKISFDF